MASCRHACSVFGLGGGLAQAETIRLAMPSTAIDDFRMTSIALASQKLPQSIAVGGITLLGQSRLITMAVCDFRHIFWATAEW
jgi:hypothetical protein